MNKLNKLTIPDVLYRTVNKYPENLSLGLVGKKAVKYSELFDYVKSVSDFLNVNGIKKGDKVAVLSESMPNWAVVFFAITSIGAVAVPIMTEFQPEEIKFIIDDSDSKGIFVSEKCSYKISEFDLSNLLFNVCLDDFSLNKNDKINISKHSLLNSFSDLVDESDIASLIYTSGTTGHSKGVLLSHLNFVSDSIATAKLSGVNSDDVLLSILPLSHTMECNVGMLTPVLVGAQIYYLDKPPTAAVLLPALQIVKPTVMVSIPLVIEKIFKQKIKPEFENKTIIKTFYRISVFRKFFNKIAGKKLMKTFGNRLRMFCIGGAPLSTDVEDFLIEAKFPYTLGYGMTEASPLISGNHPDSRRYKSSGQPIEGVQVKIDNPNPLTNMGEILVKGPNVFRGYYKNTEKTKEMFDDDGWLKTGDLGVLDKDGYLFIKDRIKNVIIGSNGKNIYPEEIESKINDLQYVAESLVFQREDKLVAKVHLNYSELETLYNNLTHKKEQFNDWINYILDEILIQINGKLPAYSKIVEIVEQNEPFLRTPTLKIKRFLYH